jgi:D-psicose/D-tagatose/L-ribulose 3-epimerase
MKIGVHLALWAQRWDDDVIPYAETAADLGFDGVELSLLGMTTDRIRAIRQALARRGLHITCTTGLSPQADISSLDPAVRAAGQEYLAQAIRTTAGLGSRLLTGVLYAPWNVRVQEQREQRWAHCVDGLRQAARVADAEGVTLGLEAINRFETDLVNTAQQATRLCEDVGMSAVGVLLDAFHMNMEEKHIGDAIRATGKRLVHFHCDENDRGVPGSGHIPWDEILEALGDIGYDGWLTLEMFIAANLAVSSDLAIWRQIEPDPTRAAREGLAFLRSRTR